MTDEHKNIDVQHEYPIVVLDEAETKALVLQVITGAGREGMTDAELKGANEAMRMWKAHATLWRMWKDGDIKVSWDNTVRDFRIWLPEFFGRSSR